MNLSQLADWFILLLILGGLLYTAIVIKNEKHAYKDSSVDIDFFNFRFYIPSWWRVATEKDNEIIYHREDTDYEWKGIFKYFKSEQELQEIIDHYLETEKIVFDQGHPELTQTDFLTNSKTIDRTESFMRLEGGATVDIEKRCYFDIFIFKDILTHEVLFAISRSSILNGQVEGPYFEEVIKTFEIIE